MAHTALGEQPHPLYALRAPTLAMDQPRVHHALQVSKTLGVPYIAQEMLGHLYNIRSTIVRKI